MSVLDELADRFLPTRLWPRDGVTVPSGCVWVADQLPDGLRMTSPDHVYVYRVVGLDLDEFMSELPKVDRDAGNVPSPDLNNSATKINTDSGPASTTGADPGGGAAAHSAPPPGDPHEDEDEPEYEAPPEPSRPVSRGRTRVLYPYDPQERGWEPAPLPRGWR